MRSPIQDYLETLHARYAGVHDGDVATYIPELASADPNWFGICVATADGHVYEVGDTRQIFTIQSISKPFVYGLAMEDRGVPAVQRKIGVEPTGEAFNSISLEQGSGRPLNPMINAGAIAASSLVGGHSDSDRRERLLSYFSTCAGRTLSLDERTYLSERETGHRNRAIGHMLRNFEILEEDPERALDLYFRQCSIRVDCRDLAMMAATLACGGVHPVTRERALRRELVGPVLSVMSTCGMYDFAGQWMHRVGLPAKSGVAGGVLAVVPGQLGIAVFSPRLDARGNSVRGIRVCEDLARDMDLHFLGAVRTAASPVHSRGSLRNLRSRHQRSAQEAAVLDAHGNTVAVYKLQGNLRFSTVEQVVRELATRQPQASTIVLDFTRAGHVDAVAERLLLDAHHRLWAEQRTLLFCGLHHHAAFRRHIQEDMAQQETCGRATFDDLDSTLEVCERRVLAANLPEHAQSVVDELAAQALCTGFEPADLEHLRGLLREERYAAGEVVLRRGDPADRLYLIAEGAVGVFVMLADGRRRRMATIAAGSSFGEAAMVLGGMRSADVYAEKALRCWSLDRAAFAQLGQTRADLKIALLRNLLLASTRVTQLMTEEVAFLEGDLRPRVEAAGTA